MTEPAEPPIRVILVTGPSGAGRSTALNALEDLGFEAIDNIPLGLVPRLLDGPTVSRPLALGLDVRNRQFSVEGLRSLREQLIAHPGIAADLLFLDADRDTLVRRYSETRRRHPLAPQASPSEGIAREIALLAPVRDQADLLIDTSELTPHELRARLHGLVEAEAGQTLSVSLLSFSYKRGLPHGADVVLDCRFLDNPYWNPDLRGLTGRDARVVAHIAADPRHGPFLEHVMGLLTFLLPACNAEGKAHFSVAFGCTGGQHRSVAVTEAVAHGLAQAGWQVSIRHRELERRGQLGLGGATAPEVGEHRT